MSSSSGRGQHQSAEKDPVLDFAKYTDQRVRVRFQGGREVEGVLKGQNLLRHRYSNSTLSFSSFLGYDKLDNLVLDDSIEFLRGMDYLLQYLIILLVLIISLSLLLLCN